MKSNIRVAIVGYGNIGRFAVDALRSAPDMELAGVGAGPVLNEPALPELAGIPVVDDISKLDEVKVALLCTPTRLVPQYAKNMLQMGINTWTAMIFTVNWPLRRELMRLPKPAER